MRFFTQKVFYSPLLQRSSKYTRGPARKRKKNFIGIKVRYYTPLKGQTDKFGSDQGPAPSVLSTPPPRKAKAGRSADPQLEFLIAKAEATEQLLQAEAKSKAVYGVQPNQGRQVLRQEEPKTMPRLREATLQERQRPYMPLGPLRHTLGRS